MRLLLSASALLVLTACGYEPPAQTDQGKPTYTADLDACQDTAAGAVNKRNAKTGLAWFSSPVRRWGQMQDEVQSCMSGKGYGRVRVCTDAELRAGARSGSMFVTSAGVRCTEPPAPERRRAG